MSCVTVGRCSAPEISSPGLSERLIWGEGDGIIVYVARADIIKADLYFQVGV